MINLKLNIEHLTYLKNDKKISGLKKGLNWKIIQFYTYLAPVFIIQNISFKNVRISYSSTAEHHPKPLYYLLINTSTVFIKHATLI